jgi:hypothetical protein
MHVLEVRTRKGKQEVVAFSLGDLGALVDLAKRLKFPGW